ncbi:MAG: alpha/beta fold hydrolase [Nevskia sp.]|nr:alpha/beta fold hydrolase [Nevskia sp.]
MMLELPDVRLPGDLVLPPRARGWVVFAHGSGSSRRSVRNRAVAAALQRRRFATLLFDLLTETEDRDYEKRFDIERLARRLREATLWLRRQDALAPRLPIGYFGASTGAAAALCAAAELGERIAAVVARGGRPDLAGDQVTRVRAPTLLIVGGDDLPVLELNRAAYALLPAAKKLAIVPGASHLFEEPGALEQVAKLAGDWFADYCVAGADPDQ